MASARQPPFLPGAGIQPVEDPMGRIRAACAMWLAGVLVSCAGTLIGATPSSAVSRVSALTAMAAAVALVLALTLPRLRPRQLDAACVALTVVGAATLALLCAWTGGLGSGYVYLFFLPAIYAGCFFTPRARTAVLVVDGAALVALGALEAPAFVEAASALAIVVASTTASIALGAERRRLREAEAEARRMALADPLTGLHNVRSVREAAASHPLAPRTAVILLDIDGFKAVNTRYGHTGADRLLVAIAEGLLLAGDERDLIARVGGDEFLVLTRGRTADEIDALAHACAAAVRDARARAGLDGPDISASLGVARYPDHGRTLDELASVADAALLAAKTNRELADALVADGSPEAAAPSSERDDGAAAAGEGKRTARSVVRGATWLLGAFIGFAGVLASDVPGSLLALSVAVFIPGVALGLVLVFARPADDHVIHRVTAIIAVPMLLYGVAVTGGPSSPLLPLLLGPVALHAHQFGTRETVTRLVKSTVVFASPLLYAPEAREPEHVVSLLVLVATAVTISVVVGHDKRALVRAERAARELARRDPLTGLYNRRAFVEEVSGRAGRQWIAVVDLDDFKRVNDLHGHAAGDRVLQRVGAALQAGVREDDFVARVGGDEFAIILPRYDRETSAALGVRLIAAVERAAAHAGYADCGVSATIGVALQQSSGAAADAVAAADAALMLAKDAGKRRVSLHAEGVGTAA